MDADKISKVKIFFQTIEADEIQNRIEKYKSIRYYTKSRLSRRNDIVSAEFHIIFQTFTMFNITFKQRIITINIIPSKLDLRAF